MAVGEETKGGQQEVRCPCTSPGVVGSEGPSPPRRARAASCDTGTSVGVLVLHGGGTGDIEAAGASVARLRWLDRGCAPTEPSRQEVSRPSQAGRDRKSTR